MNQRRIGAALTYVQTALHIVISLLYVPLLLSGIGRSEYGMYQLVGSIMAYIGITESLLSAGVLRYYCKYKAVGDTRAMENTLAVAQRIYAVLSLIVLALGAVLILVIEPIYRGSLTAEELTELRWMIGIFTGNVIINLLSYIYTAAINGYERFVFAKTLGIVSTMLQPVCVILVIRHYPCALSVVAAQTAVNASAALTRRYYALRKLGARVVYHGRDSALVRSLLVFSAGIVFAAVADQIFWKADQLILAKLYGSAVVAVYAVGAQIYGNYSPVGVAVTGVFMPRISQLYHAEGDMDTISDLFAKTGRLVFLACMLILSGFILFGRPFIRLWAGEAFEEAYAVALVVMIPYTIDVMQHLGLTILQVMNRYAFRGKVYFAIAVLNIVSTIFMAKAWGLFGAALSTAISMFLGNGLIMNWYYGARAGLDLKRFWLGAAKLLPGAAVAAAAGVGIRQLFRCDSFLSLAGGIAVYTAVYFAVMWLIGMNAYEKSLLRSFFGGRKKGRAA